MRRVARELAPKVIAVSAKEPLLPTDGRAKTLAVLKTAIVEGIECGVVTNGVFLDAFLAELDAGAKIDFLDVSVDGYGATDDAIRGSGHFEHVNRLLRVLPWHEKVRRMFISTCLNRLNAQPKELKRHLDWIRELSDAPRAALLFMYCNEHNDSSLRLTRGMALDALEIAVQAADGFDELFIEVFPNSVPEMQEFMDKGLLPSWNKLVRDEKGMLVGHVAGNLFARYVTNFDLVKYHLRISPEGHALKPEGIEAENYLSYSYGDLVRQDWAEIHSRIGDDLQFRKGYLGSEMSIVRSESVT